MQDKAEDKAKFRRECLLFLFLLIASYVCATHSPAMAQSSPANQSNSKEDESAQPPEPKKIKPLGPADEFNRGVPRSSLKILDNHEGMDAEFPPRAYFNEYNPYSLNILVLYWYHPADYWDYMKFSQGVNLQIAREFQKEGIKFAFPTSTTYLSQDGSRPLVVSLGGNLSLDREGAQTREQLE